MVPRRAIGMALIVAGIGLVLDQATKAISTGSLQPGDRIPILGDVLSLTLVYNPGAAFSLGAGSTWIFTVLAIAAAVVTVVAAVRLRGAWWGIALGLILGGTIGNLVDRLLNPPSVGQGHVTDFIAYGDLFIGNVADILLVAGVCIICGIIFTANRRTRPTGKTSPTDAPIEGPA